MAHKFKKGQSIFFLFKKGETVQDSQRKPRFYLDRTKAELYLPYGDEIVEYAPVRHGEWIDRYGGKYANQLYECSECKGKALYKVSVSTLFNEFIVQELSDYCPNCGAKMDGDSHDKA